MDTLHGSICLTDIPKELIKDFNGKKYINIKVAEYREPKTYGEGDKAVTFTHYVASTCKKDEREEGKNYYWGKLKPYGQRVEVAQPSFEDIENAPAADDDGLPF